MFKKEEYVVCGNKGVCRIEEITTLNLTGIEKDREYYILKPVYMTGSTVYVPVDAAKESMRCMISREEADRLIEEIPRIPLIMITNDKLLEQEYRNCIRTNCCTDWIRIIKTIRRRRQKRLEAGRKETAVDAKYVRIAEDNLYGELAIALGMNRREVEAFLVREMEKDTVTG